MNTHATHANNAASVRAILLGMIRNIATCNASSAAEIGNARSSVIEDDPGDGELSGDADRERELIEEHRAATHEIHHPGNRQQYDAERS